MNRIRVVLCEKEYTVLSEKAEEHVVKLAVRVNKDIREVKKQNHLFTSLDAALLCALNYIDDKQSSDENADHLREQVRDYFEESARAQIEAAELKKTIEALKRENRRLQEELSRQKQDP